MFLFCISSLLCHPVMYKYIKICFNCFKVTFKDSWECISFIVVILPYNLKKSDHQIITKLRTDEADGRIIKIMRIHPLETIDVSKNPSKSC